MAEGEYGEGQIRVLEGLEAVRLRPGMYIGSTGPRGLHHLVYEIVDNAIDEALAGHCDSIEVKVEAGGSVMVRDNGRGIPVGLHPELGIPTPELVFTRLHAGGKFGDSGYKVSGGLHGVGASVVNALSEWFEVEICRDGKVHRQRYERGAPVTGLEVGSNTRRRGTTIRFAPDPQIFKSTIEFNVQTLANRVRELAFLNPGLSIRLADGRPLDKVHEPEEEPVEADADGESEGDERPERFDETFAYPGGVADFVRYLNASRSTYHEPVVFGGTSGDIEVEIAFQYNDGYTESVNSYVNCINTVEGGQHETGFKTAHTRVMNEYARKLGVWKKKDNLSGSDVREGLMLVISLRMTGAEFEGQTKTKLGNTEARAAVDEVVSQNVAAFLDENPKVAKRLLERAAKASQARQAARKAREAVRTGRSSKMRTSLEGKLTRCASRKADENEIFIVEGDSAGGSAKLGRDRMHQAILPLRGKPLNTERATLAKVLSNKEILAIVQAVGAGVGSEFEIERANYGRVIVLADADDDGAHIRCLLLTFFYRFMRPLVSAGRVYMAQPPLFRLTRKSRGKALERYAWSKGELDKMQAQWGGRGAIQRFKGLGEMNPDQLWETTMNPESRTLVRVTIDDAATAEKQVRTLMGNDAAPRKQWIIENVRFGEDHLDGGTLAGDTVEEDEDRDQDQGDAEPADDGSAAAGS